MKPENELDAIADEAIKLFEADAPGWRLKMAELFNRLASEACPTDEKVHPRTRIEGPYLTGLFSVVGSAFEYSQRGLQNRLTAPAPVAGRPTLTSDELEARAAMAIVVGCFLSDARRQGISREQVYRLAADAIRQQCIKLGESGNRINWKQCRSVWANRNRLPDKQRASIESTLTNLHLYKRKAIIEMYAHSAARWIAIGEFWKVAPRPK